MGRSVDYRICVSKYPTNRDNQGYVKSVLNSHLINRSTPSPPLKARSPSPEIYNARKQSKSPEPELSIEEKTAKILQLVRAPRASDGANILVSNLHKRTTVLDLNKIFKEHGELKSIKIQHKPGSELTGANYAVVGFFRSRQATKN